MPSLLNTSDVVPVASESPGDEDLEHPAAANTVTANIAMTVHMTDPRTPMHTWSPAPGVTFIL
ncbi:hypothetical protein GCM10029963_18030 [Micromonospora andamanensis]